MQHYDAALYAYHGFILSKKFQCLKFRHTEVIHKKLFFSFLKMHSCEHVQLNCLMVNQLWVLLGPFYKQDM